MQGRIILVLDGSAVVQQLGSAALEEAGCRVWLTEDGLPALGEIHNAAVETALTDWIHDAHGWLRVDA